MRELARTYGVHVHSVRMAMGDSWVLGNGRVVANGRQLE